MSTQYITSRIHEHIYIYIYMYEQSFWGKLWYPGSSHVGSGNISDAFTRLWVSIDAFKSLFGASGIHNTGLACLRAPMRS